MEADLAEDGQIRDEGDEVEQHPGRAATRDPEDSRNNGEQSHPPARERKHLVTILS